MNKKFEDFNLDKYIIKALYNLNYKTPSKVQEEVIPRLLKKEDVIVKSKTGSGKTASFGIPICENIDIENNNVQALIVVPTRELALQVKDEISNIGRLKKIRCSAIFGKQPIKEQIRELKQRVHIVVATPGRIIDHIGRNTIDLDDIKYLIIDEADKMLNKGFIEDMEFILNKIPKNSAKGLFSATIDDDIQYICDKYLKVSNILDIKYNELFDKKQIIENKIKSSENDKYKNLKSIIYMENPTSLIIFCNTKDKVKKLYENMKKDGFLVEELHGDMSQDKRIFVIKDFKNNKFNILISTDVAARGIHIDDISLVINYDVPRDKENYIHRIGRTGRKDSYGKAITIFTDKDDKYINEIEAYLGYEIKVLEELKIDDIAKGKIKFEKKSKEVLKNRKNKIIEKNIHSEVTKIYINAGKKKKIRVIDIVGAFSNLPGINNEDIGVVEVQDLCSYVDILNYKGEELVKKYKEISIKKKMVKLRKDRQS
ncbi:MAG: DEAD/DEAH box helicase [Romboutsia timonensis]|uniref:DEAD/DEAH box helicase n=1 Tax=Romboutsia timonensis TaxID=1776391 RepID=UPI002A75FD95|nr:DEAD/DEAH box helicase [Romboutsia timonensis]MDY2882923.1 DEAD/DEAH box helicase [Romboutsia timonensis]